MYSSLIVLLLYIFILRSNTTSRARGYKWKENDGFGRLDQDWIKLINAIGKEEKKCFLKEVRS